MAFSPRALSKSHPHPLKVLIPLFPSFNTFDANGPIEVLSQANRNNPDPSNPSNTSPIFTLTLAADRPLTRSIEGVSIERDISLIDALARVEEWDIVLLPGGVRDVILGVIEGHEKGKERSVLMELLEGYKAVRDGLMLTVCTGSLFLAAVGGLDGRTVTSHWAALGTVKNLCERNGSKTKVVRARWVDSKEERLPRLISAGGVACGIDATFYLVELIAGAELAEKAATVMDYQRRGEELQEDYVIPEGK
ncbi:class I glutamine amidotransferase-like protein [Cadophora sp. MPI-SDFR-AT-0126]|nr:class I glutamine amidotransferase-like protein [Leotiomycetes sp. MPI-SDFR-AT-0126]